MLYNNIGIIEQATGIFAWETQQLTSVFWHENQSDFESFMPKK
jgi:hypothetical protein